MWIDCKIQTEGVEEEANLLHFISEGVATFNNELQTVSIEFDEPSTDEVRIKAKLVIEEDGVQIFRTGSYSMEQRFDSKIMTSGTLEIDNRALELTTTTFKYNSSVDFEKKSGEIDLEYAMYIQGEYSGDFHWKLKFYN